MKIGDRNHLHDAAEDSVFPYQPVGFGGILKIVSEQVNSSLED
jgi:hypothetical protein